MDIKNAYERLVDKLNEAQQDVMKGFGDSVTRIVIKPEDIERELEAIRNHCGSERHLNVE